MRADLFIGAEQQLDMRAVVERGEPMQRLDDASKHVEAARPRHHAIGDREWQPFERAHREHGVMVAKQQHCRLVAAFPMNVRTLR